MLYVIDCLTFMQQNEVTKDSIKVMM